MQVVFHHAAGPVLATLLVMLLLLLPASVTAADYALYFLGGQSNMNGYGRNADLSGPLAGVQTGVMIFHGNDAPDGDLADGRGIWATLRPGHGIGFASDGKRNEYSNRFGPELSFARRLRGIDPDVRVAIVKYARSGSSIDVAAADRYGSWHPDFSDEAMPGETVNQFDHFTATVKNARAVSDIDGDGEDDVLHPTGIVWMQGESDARFTRKIARRYRRNLTRLMAAVRETLGAPDLPIVIGRISDSGQDRDGKRWDHADVVRAAQAKFVKSDVFAALIANTDEYAYADLSHYDSAGNIDLGRRFAEALAGIRAGLYRAPQCRLPITRADPSVFNAGTINWSTWALIPAVADPR